MRYEPWSTQSDNVERVLAQLTGKTFAKSRAKWTAWGRDEAKGVLPDVALDNPTVLEFDRLAEARRKAMSEGK